MSQAMNNYNNNLKRISLSLCAAVLSVSAAFADGTITGKVLDGGSGNPLDFASVQLVNATTGKPLTIGTTTDEKGMFTLTKVPDGKYLVRVTSIGNVMQERSVTVKGNKIDLGTMTLKQDAKLLEEVVVTGIRSQMRFELDRKVFTVDAAVTAAGLSASELLENIPSVEVDQDGEVSLRGNSSVTVWINGKESGLTADNRAQILEQIPAESIERVEVITNPSAKYSPEGTAGIINIVLKADRKGGYYGSAELGGNSRGGANASVNVNYNRGKWDSFFGLGLRMRHNKNSNRSERLYETGSFLNSVGESHSHGVNAFLRLGTTFHLTEADEFSFSGFGMLGHRWSNSSTLYKSDLPDQWLQNLNSNRSMGSPKGTHAELGYKHSFSKTHTLEFLVGYNHWGGNNWSSYLRRETWPDPISDGVEDEYQEQTMNMLSNSMEAKIDYTNQLSSWLKLEAGYNGRYSHERTPNVTYTGTEKSNIELTPELYNRFIYNNNISAFYATLGGKAGNFNFSAGLRAEAWQVRTRSFAYGQTDADVAWFKKNNFALFPSAFISYSLPHDNEIQINYTRRIRRPWGGQLNSFRDISNPTSISYGNPELQPQYANAFELNYIKSWTYHIISLSAYVRTADDVINRISYLVGDVLYSTNANVSRRVNSGAEIVVKNNLFNNKFDLTTTVNLQNNHMDAWSMDFDHEGTLIPVSGKAQDSFSWSIRAMAGVRLPWGINFQATGNYRSKRITAQGSNSGGWSVDAGIRKNLGDWSFSINARDIFDSRKWHSIVNGVNYRAESWFHGGGRRIQLTIKYAFGNMKDRKKRGDGGPEQPSDDGGYGNGGGMEMD